MSKRKNVKTPLRAGDSVDDVLRHAGKLDRDLRVAAKAWKNFTARVLIPLARREGYRRGATWLLQGHHNAALIERVMDVLITDQAAVHDLTKKQIAHWLVTVYKPSPELKNLFRPGNTAIRPENAVGTFRKFLKRAVKTKKHWRVARLSASSAVKDGAS